MPSSAEENVHTKRHLHKEVKHLLTIVAVCAPSDGTAAYLNGMYMLSGAFLTFILVSGMVSSIVVIAREDFTTAINFAGDMIALIGSIATMITGFFFRENTKQLFLKLQQNYDQCNCSTFYCNQLCFDSTLYFSQTKVMNLISIR